MGNASAEELRRRFEEAGEALRPPAPDPAPAEAGFGTEPFAAPKGDLFAADGVSIIAPMGMR